MTGTKMTKQILYERDPAQAKLRARLQGLFDWVDDGIHITEIYKTLGADTPEKMLAIRRSLSREKAAGNIDTTNQRGVWRRVDRTIEFCDLSLRSEKSIKELDAKLPLQMESLVTVFRGDLIVVAGRTNSGKSSFALELAMLNKHLHPRYCSCELTIEQVQDRALKDGKSLEDLSGIQFAMKHGDYQDVMEEGCLNIVDFLSAPNGEYYLIPPLITKIHERMNGTGLLLVCLQKDKGRRSGEGGEKTLHRSNLYLTMDRQENGQHWLNVEKCKVSGSLEGYRIKYKPGKFGLESLSDWIPPARD
jgi:energy-coupling factor transporter ATP-binding protein EcfA2